MGRLQPTPADNLIRTNHNCDRCGYAAHDNSPIAKAAYEVITRNGSIYFCSHHFERNLTLIFAREYKVTRLAD